MPGVDGLQASREIARGCPGTRVVIFSGFADPAHRAAAARAGARAVVTKGASCEALLAILEAVREGRPYTASDEGMTLDGAVPAPEQPEDTQTAILTAREREVLRMVAEGHSSTGIAAHLELSVRTIETYRQRVKRKLRIHSTAGLTRFALAHGLG